MASTVGVKNPYRYRGYRYDTETGLYYLQSRYYDPEMGRFINADDIDYLDASGTVLGCNLFAYCENNPVNNSDKNGNLKIPSRFLNTLSFLLGILSQTLLYAGYITARPLLGNFITGVSIIIALAQIGVALYDYNQSLKELSKKYNKKSLKYKTGKKNLDFLLTISLISAGISLICSVIGIRYKNFQWMTGVILINFCIAGPLNMFGVAYSAAGLLTECINTKASIFRPKNIIKKIKKMR